MYRVDWSTQAKRDYANIKDTRLASKLADILNTVQRGPHEPTQQYEKLLGSRNPARYSRRINKYHRFIYAVIPNIENAKDENGIPYEGIVKVASMWAHNY